MATTKALPQLERIFIAGSKSNTGSKRARRRLKGEPGARTWESWAVLAYDVDTVARM